MRVPHRGRASDPFTDMREAPTVISYPLTDMRVPHRGRTTPVNSGAAGGTGEEWLLGLYKGWVEMG